MSIDIRRYFAPSILSADFTKIGEAIKLIEQAGGDFVHMDIMDGVFVPNLTFGHKMVADLRKRTRLPLDVHLMVVKPEEHIPRFIDAGADYITFHFEATIHVHRVLQQIIVSGKKCGISIVPSTPVHMLEDILHMVDMVLIMTVNPGFGGQNMLLKCLNKVKKLAEIRKQKDYNFLVSVDGGINPATAEAVRNAGTDVLICGSSFFCADNPLEAANDIMGKN